jgi:amino acid adenylation domain-containing protein
MTSGKNQILIQRFLNSATKYPDRPALRFPRGEYSYSDLLGLAGSFAVKLLEIHEEAPVIAIMADNTPETYAGILGILMAGKGYLPLNPAFPPLRNHYMLDKSDTRTLISTDGTISKFNEILAFSENAFNLVVRKSKAKGEHFSRSNIHILPVEGAGRRIPVQELDPEAIAYLLFTSGSTGTPKGVAVSNRNVTTYIDNMLSQFDFTPEDRFTQTFDLTFDLSVHDLFICWSVGACLCIPEDNSSFGISRYLRQFQPTVWFSVPSVATLLDRMRLLKEGAFPWLRLSFFCGEALPLPTAEAWQKAAPGSRVVNLYGPTEATIAISAYTIPVDTIQSKVRNGIVSIGKIFPGHTYILKGEEDGKGMLLLSGPQVVNGYFRDEHTTREYFMDEGTPSLFYNTGDLAAVDEEGDLYFLGRADSEVKISGYRVNLMEIDHIISAIHEVRQAATLYLETNDGNYVLVSFVVSNKGEDDVRAILEHCRKQLPHYMVPEMVIFVQDLPLNPNRKTDRKALAAIFKDKYE